MHQNDSQVLAALNYATEQDLKVKADIQRAIDSHDRAFFEQIVLRVLARLRLTVSDTRRFIDSAYEWFLRWRS